MDNDINSRIQRYIDEAGLLLSLLDDARPRTSAKTEFGNNLIATGAGAIAQDIARDLLGTGSGFYGTARRATLKYLKAQENQQYQSKIAVHESRFNGILAEVNSLFNSISMKKRGLTAAGNSQILVRKLASIHSLSKLPARIRKLRAILMSIQTEPLIYNNEIPKYLSLSAKDNAGFRNKYKNAESQTAAYELLNVLETRLRKLIEAQLSKISNNWWVERVPQDVRENAELKKVRNEKPSPWTQIIDVVKGSDGRSADLVQYVDFNDYIKIIRRGDNWKQVFKEVFRDEEVISTKLKEIEPIRNAIAHSREISRGQSERLKLHANDIIRSISKFT